MKAPGRVDLQRIDRQRCAQPFRKFQFRVVDVQPDDVKAHRLRVLHRQVPEAANPRNHHPVARLRVGRFEAFVDRDASAQDRRDLHEA